MDSLIKRIIEDGRCLEGGILKVDRFVNHQIHICFKTAIGT